MTDKLHFDDLTAITCPFAMLDDDTQDRLKAWQHGWDWFSSDGWVYFPDPSWTTVATYRAKPAPKVTSHWRNECDRWAGGWYESRAEADGCAFSDRLFVIRRDTINGVTTYHMEDV